MQNRLGSYFENFYYSVYQVDSKYSDSHLTKIIDTRVIELGLPYLWILGKEWNSESWWSMFPRWPDSDSTHLCSSMIDSDLN